MFFYKNHDLDRPLSEEAENLDEFLNQYKMLIRQKKNLESVLAETLDQLNNPLSSVNLDGMPHGSTPSEGAATIALRIDSVESRIISQQKTIEQKMEQLDFLFNYLPDDIEKDILIMRYRRRLKWDKICKHCYISKRTALRKWKKGLYMLLEEDAVRESVEIFLKRKEMRLQGLI